VFKRENGNWADYRARFGLRREHDVDFHCSKREPGTFYGEQFKGLKESLTEALKQAQAEGRPYVLFTHGWSTSRPGKMTARSLIRGFMRSPVATPFIERNGCIQHESVFLAKVRMPTRFRVAP
jgi:hypothetical protein